MEIVLLGTGSPLPDAHRAGPATLVRAEGATLLVDAGRAVVMRLMAAGVPAGILDAVLITHLHSDHITDLGDIITTRWVTSFAPSPLRVVGPVGTAAMVDALMASLAPDIGYRLAHHDDLTWEPPVEVTEVDLEGRDPAADPMLVLELGGVTVHAAATDHRPVDPSVGFRVDDGTASVVLAGDTVPCPTLDRLATGAGALVHTVIRKDLLEPVGITRIQDILNYHSSPEEAAATAQRAGVRTLVLTHYVPAPGPGELQAWFDLAATAFDGEITGGDDLHTVAVPPTGS
jgi:ribonuclease Z